MPSKGEIVNLKTFEDWLGEGLAQELQRATLGPALEIEDKYLTHSFRQVIYIPAPVLLTPERESVIRHYLAFYEELVEKIAQQAAELVPDLEFEENVTTQILDMTRKFYEMVLSGDVSCAPYMHAEQPNEAEDIRKFVAITHMLAITVPEEINEDKRRFWWLISMDAFEDTGNEDEPRTHIKQIADRFTIDEMYQNLKPDTE